MTNCKKKFKETTRLKISLRFVIPKEDNIAKNSLFSIQAVEKMANSSIIDEVLDAFKKHILELNQKFSK